MINKVKAICHELINKKIIIAVSTGVDSMVLLDIMKNLKYDIVVCHINHKVREQSNKEQTFLKKYCTDNNIIFEDILFDNKSDGNFHESSRKFRYEFFKKISMKYNIKTILTAHHKNDEVESFLMNLISGKALISYKTIKENVINGVQVLRPLIDISKEEIYSYSKENNVFYFEDNSNNESYYFRNNVRNNIIPQLKDINPNVIESIKYQSDEINDILNLMDTLIIDVINDSKLNIDLFKNLHISLQKHCIYSFINAKINNKALLDLINVLVNDKKPNYSISINNKQYTKEYGFFFIENKQGKQNYLININDVGTYNLPCGNKIVVSYNTSTNLCYNSNKLPIYVRNRENGDTIEYSYGTKKVSRLFIDNKIPSIIRETTPLVFNNNNKLLFIPILEKNNSFNYGSFIIKLLEVQNEK